jgi:hypothetical protein
MSNQPLPTPNGNQMHAFQAWVKAFQELLLSQGSLSTATQIESDARRALEQSITVSQPKQ